MITRIDNGLVWIDGQLQRGSVLIRERIIQSFLTEGSSSNQPTDNVIDATGNWILPGGIDLHTHVSDGIETLDNGTKCAAAGGITCVMDMAPFHACVTAKQFDEKKANINASCHVDTGLIAGIVVNQEDLIELPELARKGAISFKVFQPSAPPLSTQTMWLAVKTAAKTKLRMAVHAEDPALFAEPDPKDEALAFALSRPAAAETVSVAMILEMARVLEAPIHICHVSCSQSLELIKEARSRGVDVTCEVAAHNLFLNQDSFLQYGARVKTTPPLRPQKDADELWMYLQDGDIDALISDHYIESSSVIPSGLEFIQDAPAGIAGLEVSLPLLFNAVKLGKISLNRFIEITAEVPARLANIDDKKGKIGPGMDADLVFWEPDVKKQIQTRGDFSRIATSPYDGWQIQGNIAKTMVRGQIVWDGNSILSENRCGKWIAAKRSIYG
jgi:dihydroorotase (multifunctional complex type)